MTNRSRRVGTRYENQLLVDLQTVWPYCKRSYPGTPCDDYERVGFPVEAKRRMNVSTAPVLQWVRKMVATHTDGPWIIFASLGDKRKGNKVPDLAIIPRWFLIFLLQRVYGKRSVTEQLDRTVPQNEQQAREDREAYS